MTRRARQLAVILGVVAALFVWGSHLMAGRSAQLAGCPGCPTIPNGRAYPTEVYVAR